MQWGLGMKQQPQAIRAFVLYYRREKLVEPEMPCELGVKPEMGWASPPGLLSGFWRVKEGRKLQVLVFGDWFHHFGDPFCAMTPFIAQRGTWGKGGAIFRTTRQGWGKEYLDLLVLLWEFLPPAGQKITMAALIRETSFLFDEFHGGKSVNS